MNKFQALVDEFAESVKRLDDALGKPKDEFMRDSAIKRFELAFDLGWKTIKAFLEDKGVECTSPLGCFKEAYRQKLIGYEDSWIDLVKTRNKTVHTYDEALADEVYAKLPTALSSFRTLLQALR